MIVLLMSCTNISKTPAASLSLTDSFSSTPFSTSTIATNIPAFDFYKNFDDKLSAALNDYVWLNGLSKSGTTAFLGVINFIKNSNGANFNLYASGLMSDITQIYIIFTDKKIQVDGKEYFLFLSTSVFKGNIINNFYYMFLDDISDEVLADLFIDPAYSNHTLRIPNTFPVKPLYCTGFSTDDYRKARLLETLNTNNIAKDTYTIYFMPFRDYENILLCLLIGAKGNEYMVRWDTEDIANYEIIKKEAISKDVEELVIASAVIQINFTKE